MEPQAGPGYLPHPQHARPPMKDPGDPRLAMTMNDSALASHLLEYYRSLGLIPPVPRLPPEQGSAGLVRPTPVTPGHGAVTRGEPPPGYHDPRHQHQNAAYISGLEKLLIQVRGETERQFMSLFIFHT